MGGVTNFSSNTWVSFTVSVVTSGGQTNAVLNLACSNSWNGLSNVFNNLVVSNFVAPLTNHTMAFTATDGGGAHEFCYLDNVDFSINGSHIVDTNMTGPVVFTLQPVSQIVPASVAAAFSAAARGAPPFTYQWRSNGVPITGATAANYTTPPATAGMNGTLYSVAVSNSFSGAISTNATLTVLSYPVAITSPPASQTVPAGWTAMFTVGVDPNTTGPLTYQWWQISDGSSNLITGATNSYYITPSLARSENGTQFYVAVSNTFSGAISSPATMAVVQYPVTITTQPAGQTVPAGSPATLTAAIDPTGTGPITWQWWQATPGISTNPIGGAITAAYTTPALGTNDSGKQYFAVVTGAANCVTSSAATVTVLPPSQLAAPVLSPDRGSLNLNWSNGGNLLAATNVAGPWLRVAGATNSPFNVPVNSALPQQYFRAQQFGVPAPTQDYTPYVNVVQNANGQNGFNNTVLLRYPLGRIGIWSIDPGEFADCVTRGLRLYPCIDTVVDKGTTDWRNTITGGPSAVTNTYNISVPAQGSSVDLTVSPHVAIYRNHLAPASAFQAVAMMVNDLSIDVYNWSSNSFTVIDNQTIQATLNGGSKHVYYYIRFNVPSVGHGTINNSVVTDGASSTGGSSIGGYLKFNRREVLAAVAISHTSMAQAQAYFEAEFGSMNFDAAAAALRNAWIAKLGRVEAQGPTLAMQQLYTALYTVYANTIDATDNPYYTTYQPLLTIASSDYWQAVGSYLRCDWDMSRGVYQLVALMDPELFTHIINTYQAQYDRDQPRIWCNWDPFSASGFSVTMFLPDFAMLASLHGITGIDYTKLKNSLTNYYQNCYPPSFFTSRYIASGSGDSDPASHTLDYSIPMAGLANLGRMLGDSATCDYYCQFRTNYLTLYDAANQQFRTRLASGAWGTLGADFFEGDGVDYRFCAPQDPYGLLALYGPSNAVSMIDSYMRTQADFNDYQLIYEYLPIFADRADEAQLLVRNFHIPKFNTLIMSEGFWPGSRGCYYTDNAGPLACGLLGLYFIPTSGAEWMINTPSFDRVVIHGRNDLTIQTLSNSPANIYISSIQLNGSAFPSYVISGKTLVGGNNTITLSLSNSPSKLGNLYLSSADGEVTRAATDNLTWLEFDIDPMAAACSAQVYSTSSPASILLNGAGFTNWTYSPATKLITLTGVTKGTCHVSLP
jgi:putative alpha-1,2-mannosidase